MECIINLLENEAFVNGISLIVSVTVPILVMIFTLCSQNKRAEREIESRREEFQETLKKNDNYHQESIKLQEENSRISQLPFLVLNQDITIEKRGENYIFPLEIINIGNGIALEISVQTESDYGEKIKGLPFVYKEEILEYTKIYRYIGFLFTNVLPTSSKASFELMLSIYENEEVLIQKDELSIGEVHFIIKYKDAYYNEYEQDYMFQYSAIIGVGRVESSLPRLVKKNIEIN